MLNDATCFKKIFIVTGYTGCISFFIDDRVPVAFSAAWDISAFGFMLQYAWGSDRRSVVLDGVEGKEIVR